jgi:hypothetical protein
VATLPISQAQQIDHCNRETKLAKTGAEENHSRAIRRAVN